MMTIELLAPAKNRETGIAAIDHGADAVYIAGERFGAREAAGNSMNDVESLCRYAHRYGAKVYLTLNTILFDSELEQARATVIDAFNAGCDAIIVQDMALLEMDLPPVPLFASTQTDNCSPQKVKFLEDVGFRRIILARELTIKQIDEIRQASSVELETFVHGSLCVASSGKCYMSQILAGRSANRGRCAQLCRLPYDLYNEEGRKIADNQHLLSLKDLNLSSRIEDLIAAGVSSFKIEGRLKDILYVKNITAWYRKRIDAILEQSNGLTKASQGKIHFFFEPDPEKTFSRGATDYFIETRRQGMCAGTSKSTGKFCGKVISCTQRQFFMHSAETLANGDGICFFDKSGKLVGTKVNSVENEHITPLSMEGIKPGTAIFRNADRLFDKKLSGTSAVRKIGVRALVEIDEKEVRIFAEDESGLRTEMHFPHSADKAQNAEKMRKTIIAQFRKTGDSMFDLEPECNACNRFFAVSQINAWRRELLTALENKRMECYKRNEAKIIPSEIPYIAQTLDYTANISNSLAARFYHRHGVCKTENAVETGAQPQYLMFNKYCIKFELGLCPVKQNAGDTGNLYLSASGKKLQLHFDCKNCEMKIEN
ncbi:MAG: U32 family peptidase [Prevotellaceae bacterium]|jgi:putative protease|nr:U32 family peptidase [Prevotellaceae bacterium]